MKKSLLTMFVFMITAGLFMQLFNSQAADGTDPIAPDIPTLGAAAADGRVTLYWDDVAEQSLDPVTGKDFEGYRIYRSTDPYWNDMTPVTSAHGDTMWFKPLAQYDLNNDYQKYCGVHVQGVRFYLGDNTGLVHSYIDNTVRNGQIYYYAVTSYDHGVDSLGIAPIECSKYLSVGKDGAVVEMGKNVAVVKPDAPSAGFVPAAIDTPLLIWDGDGTATGTISAQIIDPVLVNNEHTYQVSFEDTIPIVSSLKAPNTKTVTLKDVTVSPFLTLIDRMPVSAINMTLPFKDGFILTLHNEASLALDTTRSGWNREGIYPILFQATRISGATIHLGTPRPYDYRVEIYDNVGVAHSVKFYYQTAKYYADMDVNFKVINITTGEPVEFAFYEQDGKDIQPGAFSAYNGRSFTDNIFFLEKDDQGAYVATWNLKFNSNINDTLNDDPKGGDILTLRTSKPFLAHDVFEFKTHKASVNKKAASNELDKIKVVPNPYVVANSWEPSTPNIDGRGPRQLHFNHLPSQCTIKIFNIRGQLVKQLEHNAVNTANGSEIWDMRTQDDLSIAYGVYIYYVDAGPLGQVTGKFAVIK